MADHALKDDEKADELVEMIEQLMSGGSGHLRGRSGKRRNERENVPQHGLLQRKYGLLSAH